MLYFLGFHDKVWWKLEEKQPQLQFHLLNTCKFRMYTSTHPRRYPKKQESYKKIFPCRTLTATTVRVSVGAVPCRNYCMSYIYFFAIISIIQHQHRQNYAWTTVQRWCSFFQNINAKKSSNKIFWTFFSSVLPSALIDEFRKSMYQIELIHYDQHSYAEGSIILIKTISNIFFIIMFSQGSWYAIGDERKTEVAKNGEAVFCVEHREFKNFRLPRGNPIAKVENYCK